MQILQEALSMIRQPQMQDIGALSDLRIYLDNQENVSDQREGVLSSGQAQIY